MGRNKPKIELIIVVVLSLIFMAPFFIAILHDRKSESVNVPANIYSAGSSRSNEVPFEVPVTIKISESILFKDGLSVELVKINNFQCEQKIACADGELSSVFAVSGGNIGEQPKEIHLDYSASSQVAEKGYVFSLGGVTETSGTITVGHEKEPADVKICYRSGCSSEICSDERNLASSCEYKPEYSCYQNGRCERQANGLCGWTQTPELIKCLGELPQNYFCATPCTGAMPNNIGCSGQKSKSQCNSLRSDQFPYRCEWRSANYKCPAYP